MPRFLLIAAVLALVFWVVSIVDCAVQPASRHRGVNKPAWLAIVVVLPVIGGILWFAIGRPRPKTVVGGVRAPDDDPDFLGRLGTAYDQDERIRQLEEELARLDAEDSGPAAPPATPPAPGDDQDDDPRSPRSGAVG